MVVNTPGGNLDGVVQIVEGAPTFHTGERVIVFLGNGDGILSVVGGLQGKFSIDNNEMVGNFSLPQFVEQVRNAVAGQ